MSDPRRPAFSLRTLFAGVKILAILVAIARTSPLAAGLLVILLAAIEDYCCA